jgi:hypothetical protein
MSDRESGVPNTGMAIFGIGQLGYRNMNRNKSLENVHRKQKAGLIDYVWKEKKME